MTYNILDEQYLKIVLNENNHLMMSPNGRRGTDVANLHLCHFFYYLPNLAAGRFCSRENITAALPFKQISFKRLEKISTSSGMQEKEALA
ncbi:hypothetical protein AVEN_94495-1 [Araneus ventricosus]|uniref:Uncharacterized protein n=1 Tax=Araneus ventricosus TaxID=182803 RepID=A0A4Y2WQE4_ARAVE|nr:hypothetical protein AVEN_94495-1 [Araneus ventricosus]